MVDGNQTLEKYPVLGTLWETEACDWGADEFTNVRGTAWLVRHAREVGIQFPRRLLFSTYAFSIDGCFYEHIYGKIQFGRQEIIQRFQYKGTIRP